jgi:hypothetical protein
MLPMQDRNKPGPNPLGPSSGKPADQHLPGTGHPMLAILARWTRDRAVGRDARARQGRREATYGQRVLRLARQPGTGRLPGQDVQLAVIVADSGQQAARPADLGGGKRLGGV